MQYYDFETKKYITEAIFAIKNKKRFIPSDVYLTNKHIKNINAIKSICLYYNTIYMIMRDGSLTSLDIEFPIDVKYHKYSSLIKQMCVDISNNKIFILLYNGSIIKLNHFAGKKTTIITDENINKIYANYGRLIYTKGNKVYGCGDNFSDSLTPLKYKPSYKSLIELFNLSNIAHIELTRRYTFIHTTKGELWGWGTSYTKYGSPLHENNTIGLIKIYSSKVKAICSSINDMYIIHKNKIKYWGFDTNGIIKVLKDNVPPNTLFEKTSLPDKWTRQNYILFNNTKEIKTLLLCLKKYKLSIKQIGRFIFEKIINYTLL